MTNITRKPCYRKDDRAMRPIHGRHEKFRESLATPTTNFPEIVNDRCCDRSYESAPDGPRWPMLGWDQRRGLKLFGREIIFEEFQPM